MTETRKPLPDCTIFLLAKAYQKAHGGFQQALKPFELTNLQHLVLEGLWYEEGQTAAELGKRLVLDKATLSGVLDRMVDGGWVEKREDPADRRAYRLYTAQKANDKKIDLIRLRKEANERLLSCLTPEEQDHLKRFLSAIIQPLPV